MGTSTRLFDFDEIRAEFNYYENIRQQEQRRQKFNIVSANLLNFLPALSFEEHEHFFRELMSYKALAVYESSVPSGISNTVITGNADILKLATSRSFIFSHYHLGPYRAFLAFLTSRDIRIAVLVDDTVYQHQKESFQKDIDRVSEFYSKPFKIELISVGNPTSLIKIAQKIKEGISLVAYMDGNSGIGGITNINQDLYIPVNFLGVNINCRKGVALLSYITQTPIVPAIGFYGHERQAHIQLYDAIIPDKQVYPSREDYVVTTTLRLFQLLEEKVKCYPHQWESWLYVQKFVNIAALHQLVMKEREISPETATENVLLFFNHREFGLFKLDNVGYLLDKRRYENYPLDETQYELLYHLSQQSAFTWKNTALTEETQLFLLNRRIVKKMQSAAIS